MPGVHAAIPQDSFRMRSVGNAQRYQQLDALAADRIAVTVITHCRGPYGSVIDSYW